MPYTQQLQEQYVPTLHTWHMPRMMCLLLRARYLISACSQSSTNEENEASVGKIINRLQSRILKLHPSVATYDNYTSYHHRCEDRSRSNLRMFHSILDLYKVRICKKLIKLLVQHTMCTKVSLNCYLS